MVVALIVSMAAAILLARRIAHPIVRLTWVVRRISGGESSLRASLAGRDESTELARAFNEMADTVQAKSAALESEMTERGLRAEELRRTSVLEAKTARAAWMPAWMIISPSPCASRTSVARSCVGCSNALRSSTRWPEKA